MFKLKSPCANCPFKIGQGSLFALHPERLEGIRSGQAFQCHKTVDYDTGECDDEGFETQGPGEHPNQCAGLMAVLAREGTPNQIMEIASRLGHLDMDALDPRGEAYASWAEVKAAHAGKEPGELHPVAPKKNRTRIKKHA